MTLCIAITVIFVLSAFGIGYTIGRSKGWVEAVRNMEDFYLHLDADKVDRDAARRSWDNQK